MKTLALLLLLNFIFSLARAETPDDISSGPDDSMAFDHQHAQTTKAKQKSTGSRVSNYTYALTTEYAILTDLAPETSPRSYLQSLDLYGAVTMFKSFEVGLDAGFKYLSVGSDIPQDSIEASDVTLKATYTSTLNKTFGLQTGLLTSLPTSDAAKVDGYTAVETGFVALGANVVNGIYAIRNILSAGYIFNRYSFSPGTGLSNADSFGEYTLVNSLRFNRHFSFDFGLGSRLSHSLDGTAAFHFQNTEALIFSYSHWLVSASYANGSYADQSNLDLWFVDRYRQILGLGIAYEI